jgi:hypothetical protein
MSNDIRAYEDSSKDYRNEMLRLTATVQNFKGAIQFTIGNQYVILSKEQLLDMIGAISFRLLGKSGYSATGDISDIDIDTQSEYNENTKKDLGLDRGIT